MKKQLLNLSMVVAALALYITASATPLAPYRGMEVPYCAVTVDGTLDDCYSAEQSTDWMYPDQQDGYEGPSDFTAVFNVAYDLEHLYILATLTDDVAENFAWGYSSEWMFDNIEWFVQLDTNTTATAYDDNTEQLRIDRGLDSVMTPGTAGRAIYEGLYYMEDPTGTGWLTEVGMPWGAACMGGVLPDDISVYIADAMGFDFAGADSDNSDGDATVGNRDYQTGWDGDGQDGMEDQAWQNVTTFGYITFEIVDDVATTTDNSLQASPNPASSTINFGVTGLQTVEIYGMAGNLIQVAAIEDGNFDVTGLNSGMYIAKINKKSVKFAVK